MRSKFALLAFTAAIAGCQHKPYDQPERGLAATNVPVIARADYVFDGAAPDGMLSPTEAARLEAWFQSLRLGYGDSVYVDGSYAETARAQVAAIAGQHGMMVSQGAPVTAGTVAPGTVRIVVSRTQAMVPGCPNWNVAAQPNYNNRSMSNFGCAVNSNLAAMVANPEDLVHGQEGSGVGDAITASKAVGVYRTQEPTGKKGLTDINTKKGEQ